MGGDLGATLELRGTLEAPDTRLYGSLANLRFATVALGSARFDVRGTGRGQRLSVALGGQGRDDLKVKGTTGLDLRLSTLRQGLDWRAAAVDVGLDAANFDLGFLSGATERLRVVAGRLSMNGEVTGTLGAPRFVGDASLSKGRLALAGNGEFRDMEFELHATNDLFELSRLFLKSGAGQAELRARAERQPSGSFRLAATAKTDRLPLVNDDQLLANASLSLELSGEATEKRVNITRLSLPRVDIGLPEVKRKDLQDLQRPRDIIVLRDGRRPTQRQRDEAKHAGDRPKEEPFVVSALLDAPRNIWVRSADLNVELGLSEGFRVEYGDALRLFGEATVLRGNIEVIGREFSINKGSQARFVGLATQPYVNVSALHVNEREQVKITVTVAGRGSDVKITPTSEPAMPESDIYTVLATGRRQLQRGTGAALSAGQALSVVGQFVTSKAKTVLAKALPIDVLNFETSDDLQRLKVDVGKYLSDSLYLGGSANIGADRNRGENVFSGRLEYQVTKSVAIEAYAGDALSFGVDAVWSRDF
jgi:translocation and assembly module TamB